MIIKPTIGFAGLTHLGINSAVAAAAKGFRVMGFHEDESLVSSLNEGNLPVEEPGLSDLFREHKQRMTFSAESSALNDCDIVYISADVPTNDLGESDLFPIRDIIDTAVAAMKNSALLVVLCQVPPGYTRTLPFEPERLYYQVETLIFGRAVERALYPERFIIGCANPELPMSSSLTIYLQSFDCPILPMRYESAELAKISINMCLVASVSVANVMAEICEHIGADWSEVVPALRLDRRIGQYSYISPGLGISGGNLERDLATVLRLSEFHETDAGAVLAWLVNSSHRKNWPFITLEQMILKENPEAAITVLGLAYKENTHSTKNSPAFVLIERLSASKVTVYDPLVPASSVGHNVSGAASALAAIDGADALLIMTPWPEFRSLKPEEIKIRMKGHIVIDPYRILDAREVGAAGLDYATLGMPIIISKH